jgi:glycosyltransferase involved in cell wall biosynthesis
VLQRLNAPGRILMTLDAVGGIWRYAMNVAAGLRDIGIETVFAGLGPAPSIEQRREAERLGDLVWIEAPLDWTASDESELRDVPELIAALASEKKADLLHLNLPSQAWRMHTSCPVVVVSHSCVVTWFSGVRGEAVPPAWAWHQKLNRAGLENADAVVAPSRSHADMLLACYGAIRGLSVVPNAVATCPFGDSKQDYVFAVARWWDEGKNGRVLDCAARKMRLPVRMAGPTTGPNGQTIEISHAEKLGELPNQAVRRLMGRAVIFVSPSLYEPFGLAALEAAQAEAVLVLSDIPTYREFWDGAALFADPGEPEAFADAVNRLAQDAALCSALASRASARMRRFSPQTQARALLDVYTSAAARSLTRRAEVMV